MPAAIWPVLAAAISAVCLIVAQGILTVYGNGLSLWSLIVRPPTTVGFLLTPIAVLTVAAIAMTLARIRAGLGVIGAIAAAFGLLDGVYLWSVARSPGLDDWGSFTLGAMAPEIACIWMTVGLCFLGAAVAWAGRAAITGRR